MSDLDSLTPASGFQITAQSSEPLANANSSKKFSDLFGGPLEFSHLMPYNAQMQHKYKSFKTIKELAESEENESKQSQDKMDNISELEEDSKSISSGTSGPSQSSKPSKASPGEFDNSQKE